MKSKIQIKPIILCGGSGTRLWPLSRAGFPKQFLSLVGKNSLFQNAVERVNNVSSDEINVNETLVITGEEHRFIALDQLSELPHISAKLLLEPEPKNTAPALTLASLQAQKTDNDPILVVTPSDQIIEDHNAFIDAIQNAVKVASLGSIVILGVKPTRPDTGFGYIKQKKLPGNYNKFDVLEFIEKPSLEKAKIFLKTEEYSWNGGIFVMRASVWLNAIKFFRTDIFEASEAAFNFMETDQQFIRPDSELFKKIPVESIDYAVIEKCPGSEFNLKMISLDAGWSDLGAWDTVWQFGSKDDNGNLIKGDSIVESSSNNLIYSNYRLVGAFGVNNLVIVETADAVLVTSRDKSQQIKELVKKLSHQSREEHIFHRKVSRPWGWFDTIDHGDRFKVKRIQVNPGSSLSLQRHFKRAEHWVVVKGTAEVICGDKVTILKENESTFIPIGYQHRLSNPSKLQVLEIIEVQSGTYLGEDDIFREEDDYGRK